VIFTPHDDQRKAIRHLQQRRRAMLCSPMGGGKTVSTLTALESLSVVEEVYPVLVLGPLRVIRSTWPTEIRKWAHLRHLTVSVITGNAAERMAALRVKADVYTMNYDNLVWLVEVCGSSWPFRTVIADEITRLKSFRLRQGGRRAQALAQVAHGPVTRFYGLTGTPAPNGIKDLWGPTWFLDRGHRLGRSYTAFSQRWFRVADTGYGLVPLSHSQDEIQDLLRDIYLTVAPAPVEEPIVSPVYIDLPPRAREAYREMEKKAFLWLETHGVEAANAAVKLNKCLQIASGFIFDEDGVWHEIHRAKVDALDSIIEEANGAPVLVSYNFVPDLERLRKHYKHARVLDTNPKTIDDWNAGRINLLLAHPASAGHGLNLAEGGNILARFGFDWNLENYMQILERIGPLRQRQAGLNRAVFDYPIIARRTADELVQRRLEGKQTVQQILLEALEARTAA
jgi:SNF2 family DNA or RNA helicase